MSTVHAPLRYYDPPPQALLDQIDGVVAKEGTFVERPTEPGGAGKYGVSFSQYQSWEKLHGRPVPDMDQFKEMDRQVAVDIYCTMYAPPIFWHLLAPGVNLVQLDSSVNNGVSGSIRIAQRALGFKGDDVDGTMGPDTLWAMTHRPRHALIDALCNQRLIDQRDYKNFLVVATDGEGKPVQKDGRDLTWGEIWTNRVNAVRKHAHVLADAK